jgi:hypothetical protein
MALAILVILIVNEDLKWQQKLKQCLVALIHA